MTLAVTTSDTKMPVDDDPPRRRVDDYVTYRDMVEYFTKQEAEWHTMRAESYLQMNLHLEKLESALNKSFLSIEKRFNGHEDWHRNVLQGFIDRATETKISAGALITSILGIVISTAVAIFAVVNGA